MNISVSWSLHILFYPCTRWESGFFFLIFSSAPHNFRQYFHPPPPPCCDPSQENIFDNNAVLLSFNIIFRATIQFCLTLHWFLFILSSMALIPSRIVTCNEIILLGHFTIFFDYFQYQLGHVLPHPFFSYSGVRCRSPTEPIKSSFFFLDNLRAIQPLSVIHTSAFSHWRPHLFTTTSGNIMFTRYICSSPFIFFII